MKTIKIIDLLNKIANGEELPKKIKWGVHNFTWYLYEYLALDELGKPNIFECAGSVSQSILTDEVEIIEDTPKENNKIEKLGAFNIKKFYDDYPETAHFILEMFNKQEELIDKVNGE